MRGFPLCIGVVGRILNRCKIMNIQIKRHHDNTSGMLTCCTLYTLTLLCQIQALCITHRTGQIHFLFITLYITKSSLFRHSADCACPKYMILAKHLFGISMRIGLIITREIQINIGDFISLKPKKGLKGNIVSISAYNLPTVGTGNIR